MKKSNKRKKTVKECGCRPAVFEYDDIVGFSTRKIMCKFHADEYRAALTKSK